ncbi:MAG: LacI family DNA-binding transcriptional regulator [Petrotogales bacterium]
MIVIRPTLTEIAKELGIAVSTVSRALNRKEGVSEELREKVLNKALKMGYIDEIPNIVQQSQNIIGVIVPNIQNPFFLTFLKGIETVLFRMNHTFIVCNTDENIVKERVYLKWLLESKVKGVIAAPAFSISDETNISLYKKINQYIPVVLYDREFYESNNFDSVIVDNQVAIIDGVRHLKEKGHKRIGILLSKRGNYCIEERYKGFKKALRYFNLNTKKKWILENLYPSTTAEKSLNNFFDLENKPTAVIATNHDISYSFLRMAKKHNIRIPDDISLLGFSEVPENEIVNPPLTVIKQPILEIGNIAATAMLTRVENKNKEASKIVLKATIVERESVINLK